MREPGGLLVEQLDRLCLGVGKPAPNEPGGQRHLDSRRLLVAESAADAASRRRTGTWFDARASNFFHHQPIFRLTLRADGTSYETFLRHRLIIPCLENIRRASTLRVPEPLPDGRRARC